MKKVLSILMVLAMMCTSMAFVGCSSAVEGQSETPSSQAADNAAGVAVLAALREGGAALC